MKKFKNVIIYILWLILFLFISYLYGNVIIVTIDNLAIDAGCEPLFLDIASYEFTFGCRFVFAYFLLALNYILTKVSLYIFSYKLYFGKNNWYKFFREREKIQAKQNSLDYQLYLKGDTID